jgi:hypothetical protein
MVVVNGRDVTAAEALALAGVDQLAPGAVVFWSGAGVSHDGPTCAPLGLELAKRVLDHLFEPGCAACVRGYYRRLGVRREYPRLETILDVVHRIVGADALLDVLGDLRSPPPNDLHAFFARHLDDDGRHVTANFDDGVERSRARPTTEELLHVHGSFAADPTGERLGATLANVQRGFSPELRERLRAVVTAAEVEAIVFAGYSGYDAFDVDPFLRSLEQAKELDGTKVVWIRFRRSGDDVVTFRTDSPDERVGRAFRRLRAAGASCCELEGELRPVLAAFAAHWGWPRDLLPAPPPCGNTWAGTFSATPEQRRRASLELYAMMGLHPEVRRLFAARPPSTPSELELAAHSVAAAGRYREAARLWRAAVPGSSADERARREQHVASCWWREGRLLRAYGHLRRELERADAAGVRGEPLWHLASTTAHVFGHMRRRPLLRFFVTRRRQRFVARYLPRDDPAGYASHGPHLDAMLTAARSRVGLAQERSEEASLMFDEAEALHGMLNFRHASLRRRGSQRDRSQWPTRHEVVTHRENFRELGLDADAARVPLLPRASRFFRPGDVWRGLAGPDFTVWHRLTLFAAYVVGRARRR